MEDICIGLVMAPGPRGSNRRRMQPSQHLWLGWQALGIQPLTMTWDRRAARGPPLTQSMWAAMQMLLLKVEIKWSSYVDIVILAAGAGHPAVQHPPWFDGRRMQPGGQHARHFGSHQPRAC